MLKRCWFNSVVIFKVVLYGSAPKAFFGGKCFCSSPDWQDYERQWFIQSPVKCPFTNIVQLMNFPLFPVLPVQCLIRSQYKQYNKQLQNWGCICRLSLQNTEKKLVLGHLTFKQNHYAIRDQYFISFTSSLISQCLLNKGFGSRRYSLSLCGFFMQTMWQQAKRTLWVLTQEGSFSAWMCRLSLQKVLIFVFLSVYGTDAIMIYALLLVFTCIVSTVPIFGFISRCFSTRNISVYAIM